MWFIHFGWKYKKATHDKVIESCDPPLRASDKTTINNLRFLNIPLHDYKYEKEEKKKLQTIRNLKQSRAKEIEQPKPTTLIEPDLVSIVSRHIDMSLNKSEYPWNDPLVKEPTQELIDLGELPINEPMWYTHKETGQTTQKGKSMRKARGIGPGGTHHVSVLLPHGVSGPGRAAVGFAQNRHSHDGRGAVAAPGLRAGIHDGFDLCGKTPSDTRRQGRWFSVGVHGGRHSYTTTAARHYTH
jgi:hypothetical protein